METSELRQMSIELNELRNMDCKYTFYYDESNNFRKINIKDNKLNVPINSNFVLGGVVHKGSNHNFIFNDLVKELKLQNDIKEIKFKNIASGKFTDCLKSKKLKIFLERIYKSDLYIHYFILNFFYYSIVDIVDSAIGNSKYKYIFDIEFTNLLKSNLYIIAKDNESEFLKILNNYDYPNIEKDNIVDFIKNIIKYIRRYEDRVELKNGLAWLIKILDESIDRNEMIFLEDNVSKILIEDFMFFYVNPIYMFINSVHKFDEESTVFEKISRCNFTYKNVALSNYCQINSKCSGLVQVSDVISGLMAKMTDYFTEHNIAQILEDVDNFNELQEDNFNLICSLIDKSNECNEAFLHTSLSYEDRMKYVAFNL